MGSLALGLAFALIACTGVLLGAGLVTALGRVRRTSSLPILVAFAAGTLLATALLELLPESADRVPLTSATSLVLAAIIGFFLLERWVLWRHCHDGDCPEHSAAGYLILVGDTVHNAVDGLVVGAAFAADPGLGVLAGVAVLAHEVPQEISDFALLLEQGLSPVRALVYNLLSAAAIFPGVVAGVLLTEAVEPALPVALALATGGFLYVALADLLPMLHRHEFGWVRTIRLQLAPLLAGVLVIWLLGQWEL